MGTRISNNFLAASAAAAKDLATAQFRRAVLEAKADERLVQAQQRHSFDLTEAQRVEAGAWTQLMAVPGMTVATAAQIGGTTVIKVSRWIKSKPVTKCS